ncbi:M48 family metallopeptidase [Jannaschia sp. LMIT008]|uniref:M48 family metallopeptidase n=1 Tax=Jannaschia maritima TaxID=3032585 RepID=UPI002811419F|nr:M48 family metallopeptidase [Jannaschia sp. LMIT008]
MASESDLRALDGRAYPPDHAHETPARLILDGDAVRLEDAAGTVLRTAPRTGIVLEPALGRTERTIRLPDGTLFLTRDPGLAHAFDDDGGLLHLLESLRGPRLLAVALGTLVATAVLLRVAVPVLVTLAVWLTPPALVRQLDAGSLQAIDALMMDDTRLPADDRAWVSALFDDLRAAAPPPPRGARDVLLFRDMGGTPNAFALPGGTVVVTDGLVDALRDDPDALAGVIAHELAHVRERHGLHGLYRALGIYAMLSLLVGDPGPVLDSLLLEGNTLLQLAGTRAAERDADAGAVPILRAAGYDPDGLARFLDDIADRYGDGGGWWSTHPASSERARDLRDAIRR